jgi:hypothetical protein
VNFQVKDIRTGREMEQPVEQVEIQRGQVAMLTTRRRQLTIPAKPYNPADMDAQRPVEETSRWSSKTTK